MTMLDRMRRHKNVLKWSLFLVVVAFVLLYIPDFLASGTGAVPTGAVAEVGGESISANEFSRIYNTQLQAAMNAYGGANADLLRQLGFDRQILNQLIDERVAMAEARRLGLSVTDAEVRERILRMPGLQENGQFIGEQRYRQLLQLQRPPMTTAEFEEGLRRSLLVEKLQASIADWITVADREVDAEYRQRNEQVKLDLVSFSADAFRDQVSVSDAELQAFFDGRKETYRIGEKKKIRFLPVSLQTIRSTITIPPQDVEASYNANIEQYSTPEQIRASHILLKTEGADAAEVRKKAEDLLARARGGADFAALATEFSQDEGSQPRGGDLDYFSRGRMVPEFEQAAFALEPGAISDIVQTQFGLHVIMLTDKRPANVRPLDEVREQIAEQLKWERAQRQAQQTADRLAPLIKTPDDLATIAASNRLAVQESGFFAMDEPVAGLGPSPDVSAEAFRLAPGAVSGALSTADGFAFITVIDSQASRLSSLDEVKDRAREDAIRDAATKLARVKASQVAASLKSATDYARAAKTAGVEMQTSELVARGSALPGVGVSAAVDAAAFALPVGGVSDPIETPSGPVVIRVAERKEVSAADLASNRDTLRREMAAERRNRFFNSYMTKAKEDGRVKISINSELLQRLVS
jgi:peptidyl-prolyl cis-trans isomerase D